MPHEIEAQLVGPHKELGSFAVYTSFVCLNLFRLTPHAVALDKVLSLSPN